VPIRRSGGTTVSVRVWADHFGAISCIAVVNTSNNNRVAQFPESVFEPVGNSMLGFSEVPLGRLNVPRTTTLHFDCVLDGGNSAQLISVDWTQD
jgi:hypothetical protein